MNKKIIFSNKKTYFILGIVVCIAFLLRIYGIGSLPASLYWDEVAIAYNSFSISETLKDEYGKFLPILFRSYDDYKMPSYIYILAVLIKIFGMNEFVTRLPSAIFGTLTVGFSFFLIRRLFDENKGNYFKSSNVALVGTLLFALSPWHIQFSRGAFEANLALFFVVLGVLTFYKGFKKFNYLIISFTSFAFAFYSYRSILVFLPILIFGFLVLYRKELTRYRLKSFFLIATFLVIVIPIIHSVYFQGYARTSQTSIVNEVEEIALKTFEEGKPIDKRLLYPIVIVNNLIKEISPEFLFLKGDPNARHSPEGMGMLYLWEAPFLILGIFTLFKFVSLRIRLVIAIWFFAAILPVLLTTPAPHALRSLNILPIPQILSALGIIFAATIIPKSYFKLYVLVLIFTILMSLVVFINLYQKAYSVNSVNAWGDGYKQLYSYLIQNEKGYDSIIVSGEYWQPYAYALFYKKYDPYLFQSTGSSAGFSNYYFGGTGWDTNIKRPTLKDVNLKEFGEGEKILVALSVNEYDAQRENVIKLHEIRDLQGNTVFIIGEVK